MPVKTGIQLGLDRDSRIRGTDGHGSSPSLQMHEIPFVLSLSKYGRLLCYRR